MRKPQIFNVFFFCKLLSAISAQAERFNPKWIILSPELCLFAIIIKYHRRIQPCCESIGIFIRFRIKLPV